MGEEHDQHAAVAPRGDTGDKNARWPKRALRGLAVVAGFAVVVGVSSVWQPVPQQSGVTYRGVLEVRERVGFLA